MLPCCDVACAARVGRMCRMHDANARPAKRMEMGGFFHFREWEQGTSNQAQKATNRQARGEAVNLAIMTAHKQQRWWWWWWGTQAKKRKPYNWAVFVFFFAMCGKFTFLVALPSHLLNTKLHIMCDTFRRPTEACTLCSPSFPGAFTSTQIKM